MTKSSPSNTTTCTCRFEVDVSWGKMPTLTLTLNQQFNSSQNQPLSQRSWSHCQVMRW